MLRQLNCSGKKLTQINDELIQNGENLMKFLHKISSELRYSCTKSQINIDYFRREMRVTKADLSVDIMLFAFELDDISIQFQTVKYMIPFFNRKLKSEYTDFLSKFESQ